MRWALLIALVGCSFQAPDPGPGPGGDDGPLPPGDLAGVSCVGEDTYVACFPTPTVGVTLPSTVDTDSSICAAEMPIGWMGQPDSCFIVGTTITASGTSVFGSRPLMLWATDSITITGDIDVASHRGGKTGPGAPGAACQAFGSPPTTNAQGAGGGAGGTFRTKGGNGGHGHWLTRRRHPASSNWC